MVSVIFYLNFEKKYLDAFFYAELIRNDKDSINLIQTHDFITLIMVNVIFYLNFEKKFLDAFFYAEYICNDNYGYHIDGIVTHEIVIVIKS